MNRFEWKLMLDQYSDQALELLGRYSDTIFDKVMMSVEYLENRTEKSIQLIKCTSKDMELICLNIPTYSKLNLLDKTSIIDFENNKFCAYKSSRKLIPYEDKRENEIFNLIESGFRVVEGKIFSYLSIMRQTYLN